MCGIAGIVDFKGNGIDRSLLKVMCDAMSHRGPDDEGYYFSENLRTSIGLGHRRLSIIDLEKGIRREIDNLYVFSPLVLPVLFQVSTHLCVSK